VFCQNDDISMTSDGHPLEAQELAGVFLRIAEMGCHNLNLVTPTHVVPMILEALDLAVAGGFDRPVVYNTGGYDDADVLRQLEGVVDIYMPDAKFAHAEVARVLCEAPDYPEVNRAALREMFRQVGDLEIGGDGLAVRGLLVRHLVMPQDMAGTSETMEFLAQEISTDTYLNLMDQYRPCAGARHAPAIDRPVTAAEMTEARHAARMAGLERLDSDQGGWLGG